MADTRAIADSIYTTVEASIEKAHIVDGLDVKSARAIVDIADAVITEVEKLEHDTLIGITGPEQKEIAIEVISRLITVDIKWVPNFVEEKAKRYIVSSVVEFVLSWIDKKFNKNWGN